MTSTPSKKTVSQLQSEIAEARALVGKISAICDATTDQFSQRYKRGRYVSTIASRKVQRLNHMHARLAMRDVLKQANDLADKEILASQANLKAKTGELAATNAQLAKQEELRRPVSSRLQQLGQSDEGALAKAQADIEAATIAGDQAALTKAVAALNAANTRVRAAQDEVAVLRIQDAAHERRVAELNARASSLSADVESAQAALTQALLEPAAIRFDSAVLDAIDACVDYMATGALFERQVKDGLLLVGSSKLVQQLGRDFLTAVNIDYSKALLLVEAVSKQDKETCLSEDLMKLDAGKPAPMALPEVESRYQPGSAAYRQEQEAAAGRLHS